MSSDALAAIADQLVAWCREDKARACLDHLYAPDAVSVEAMAGPGGREAVGLDAIRAKHTWWENTMQVHDAAVDGPFLHGDDRFGVIFEVDVTNRETGDRSRMKELGIYTVKDGKIVREEFFYTC
ncbi:MAG: nuclear transport factor 2 family protein [Alphaproteobacteria bacterium]|nr:nuclear transport factor 2 family protein [Alphaproteobacteria bacterium]